MIALSQILPGLQHMARTAVDAVLPPGCAVCGVRTAEPHSLCPSCWAKLKPIARPFCERLALPFVLDAGPDAVSPAALADPPPWNRARASVLFDDVARNLVHRLKYSDDHTVAPLLARLMATAGQDILEDADVIIPVPLHAARLFQRRFNQSALLAKHIARITGCPTSLEALQRRRATAPQVGLDRSRRATNVDGAFVVPKALRPGLAGKRIVLVDDVLTTGATLSEATRALKQARVQCVDVLVFGRSGQPI